MNQNNNDNNIVGYDAQTGLPIYASVYNQNNNMQNIGQFQQPTQNPQGKKFNKKFLTIILIIVGCIALGVGVAVFILKSSDKLEFVNVTSSFKSRDGHYVLQDENGNVLLDNIKSHGGFCNGTTEVQNTNGEYGIINGSGKFVAEYGKYKNVDQYSSWGGKYYCFYKVTDAKNSQSYILKYDGSVFYTDNNDKYLGDVSLKVYDTTTRFALFKTKTEFQFVNYLGDVFFTLKNNGTDEPDIMSADNKNVYDRYLAIYYNDKTYVYDLNTFKLFNTFDGKYMVKGISISNEKSSIAGVEKNDEKVSLIIFGQPTNGKDSSSRTYLYHEGKLIFETDKCLNAAFVNGNELRCLVQNGGVFEYYDINGNKLKDGNK